MEYFLRLFDEAVGGTFPDEFFIETEGFEDGDSSEPTVKKARPGSGASAGEGDITQDGEKPQTQEGDRTQTQEADRTDTKEGDRTQDSTATADGEMSHFR